MTCESWWARARCLRENWLWEFCVLAVRRLCPLWHHKGMAPSSSCFSTSFREKVDQAKDFSFSTRSGMSRNAYCVPQLTIAASPFILLVSVCGLQPARARSARRKTDALDFPVPALWCFSISQLSPSPPTSPEGDERIDQMQTHPSFLTLPAHLRPKMFRRAAFVSPPLCRSSLRSAHTGSGGPRRR